MSEHWSVAIRPALASPEQVYFILQMASDGPEPFPVAMSSSRKAISDMCNDLNDILSEDTEAYTIEHLFTDSGSMNYSFYRDADKMGWFQE